jgi:hypothetical protein
MFEGPGSQKSRGSKIHQSHQESSLSELVVENPRCISKRQSNCNSKRIDRTGILKKSGDINKPNRLGGTKKFAINSRLIGDATNDHHDGK